MTRVAALPWAVALLASACSWTVPPPNVPMDAAVDRPQTAADAVTDSPGLDALDGGGDGGPQADASGLDVVDGRAGADTGSDVPGAVDAGVDAPSVDAPADAPHGDTEATDVPLAEGGADGGAEGGVDGGVDVTVPADAECMPGDTRACYDGTVASQNIGACRDGTQTCSAAGIWSGCTGEIVPDCVNRVCGSDECGGSCGTCASGTVCNDAGRCVTLACGVAEFVLTCADGTTCPTGSLCASGGSCMCQAGYIAVDCMGEACAPCTYPNWLCVPSPFCGAGEVVCHSGAHCPRHSTCDPASGACLCNVGYTATTCGGTRCTSCPGTEYQCSPLPS